MFDKPFTFDRVFRIALAVVVVWTLIFLTGYLSDVLVPFAIALLLAYLINPMVSWIQRKMRFGPRMLAVLVSLAIIIGFVMILLVILIPIILAEMTHMKELLTNVVNVANIRQQVTELVPREVGRYIEVFLTDEDFLLFLNFENIKAVAQQVLSGIWGVFSGTISFVIGLFSLVIIMMYLIFILLDFDQVSEGWKDLIPPQYKDTVLAVLDDFTSAMRNYFRAQSLIAFLVGVLFAIGFWSIGLPMGVLLGLFIGVLNMVPYLQAAGLIPATAFALMSSLETGESAWVMIGLVLAIFVVVQLIQDVVLVPKIMGKVTGFNPAVILLSLTVWGKLLGMLGLIIALPATFLIHSYYTRFLSLSQAPGGPPVVPPAPPEVTVVPQDDS
ncbi:MAG: AI-2E family transporter [Gemmatimonadota bacterium]|nr:AI-2E family transporter [Gemmatimonadota bacterium]